MEQKGGKCHDCSQRFPDCCFDFDHRDPATKSFNISQNTRPLRTLMAEVKKCDMVCANCHRIRTAGNPAIATKMSRAQIKRWQRRKQQTPQEGTQ